MSKEKMMIAMTAIISIAICVCVLEIGSCYRDTTIPVPATQPTYDLIRGN